MLRTGDKNSLFEGLSIGETGVGCQEESDRKILWSQRGASIWRSQFRARLDVVSVSRAPMTPGDLEMVEI